MIKAALPNSVALFMDHESGDPPESMGGKLVAASASCVAVGTLAEQSGPTQFLLTHTASDVDLAEMQLVFDGQIRVTSGELALVDTLNTKLMQLPVANDDVRLRVFVNDDAEPDQIAVVVG